MNFLPWKKAWNSHPKGWGSSFHQQSMSQQKVSHNGPSRAWSKCLQWFMKLHLNLEDEAFSTLKVFAASSQSFNLCFEYCSYAMVAGKEKHWDIIIANTSPDQIWYNRKSISIYTHIYLCHIDAVLILSSSIFQLLQLQLRISYPVLFDLDSLLKFTHQF